MMEDEPEVTVDTSEWEEVRRELAEEPKTVEIPYGLLQLLRRKSARPECPSWKRRS